MVVSSKGESLLEYRCNYCNKLLFKGLLLVSTVEIKCKKCSKICTFHWIDKSINPNYCLVVDPRGVVVNASTDLAAMQGENWNDMVGHSVQTLLPRLGYPASSASLMNAWTMPNHLDHSFEFEDSTQRDGAIQQLLLRWSFIRYSGNEYMIVRMRPRGVAGVARPEPAARRSMRAAGTPVSSFA